MPESTGTATTSPSRSSTRQPAPTARNKRAASGSRLALPLCPFIPLGTRPAPEKVTASITGSTWDLSSAVVLNHPRATPSGYCATMLPTSAKVARYGMQCAISLQENGPIVSGRRGLWLRQRRMMPPQFHLQRLAALNKLMVEAIAEVLNSWQEAADTAVPFNLLPAFNRLTMEVLVRTLFGTALAPTELVETAKAMTYALDYTAQAMIVGNFPTWLPVPGRKKYQQALARFDEIVYRIIAQCRAGELAENHLLAMLLNVVDEENSEDMTDKQLRKK